MLMCTKKTVNDTSGKVTTQSFGDKNGMSVSPLLASEMRKGYDNRKRAIVTKISNVYLYSDCLLGSERCRRIQKMAKQGSTLCGYNLEGTVQLRLFIHRFNPF